MVLRSHNQIPASHWSTVPYEGGGCYFFLYHNYHEICSDILFVYLFCVFNLIFFIKGPPFFESVHNFFLLLGVQVFGHDWLCHPTLPRGQFSENFNLLTGFFIQEIKVQTLIIFFDSLYQ